MENEWIYDNIYISRDDKQKTNEKKEKKWLRRRWVKIGLRLNSKTE